MSDEENRRDADVVTKWELKSRRGERKKQSRAKWAIQTITSRYANFAG